MALHATADRLEAEFGGCFTRDTLEHYVHDSYERLAAKSKVRSHVPTFVERFARQRLAALAKTQGLIRDHRPEVLFVCARNDALSQMAASLFNAAVGEQACAHSAGTSPAPVLLEEAVEVMGEIGIDMSTELPKAITEEIERAADVIVTLDGHDDIAILDDKRYLAWRLPPVADAGIDGYRVVRDDLRARVDGLVAEIVSDALPVPRHASDTELDGRGDDPIGGGRARRP
jgi:arsenate reductase